MSSGWELDWFEHSTAPRHMQAWRGVEAQHIVSTMRLVDIPEEQHLLEQLLETSKPSLPALPEPQHYLLATPFRYRPAHASRFRPARSKGCWYGAHTIYGACAELAYWRHRFLMDSTGLRDEVLLTEHSLFQAYISGQSIDLMTAPWVQARAMWTAPSDYQATHTLATAAKARGIQWIRYESVRAPTTPCAVVFDPVCLSEPSPSLDHTLQRWVCKTTQNSVMFTGRAQSFLWTF